MGHPGVAHPSPSWKPLALNSTTNAGLVAASDVVKKYWVDRLLNFEGAPAYPVPSPDSAGETAGFGAPDSVAQVREPGGVQIPEYIQELEDIQVLVMGQKMYKSLSMCIPLRGFIFLLMHSLRRA